MGLLLVYFLMLSFSLFPCTWPQRPVCSERLQIEQLIKAVMTQAVLLLSSRSIIYAVTLSASVRVGFKDDRSAFASWICLPTNIRVVCLII